MYKDPEARKAAAAARYARKKADPVAYAAMRESNRKRVAAYRDRLRAADPEEVKARARRSNLRNKYSITPEDVLTMLDEQDHKCCICKSQLLKQNGSKNCKRTHAVDHCHESGRVRGILCIRCNLGLGYFKDNATTLVAAARYIQENSIES